MSMRLMIVLVPLATFWAEPCSDAVPVEAAGRDLFATHCATCHGEDAKGGGPRADSLGKPPADLTRLGQKYGMPLPVDTPAEFIDGRNDTQDGREMPAFSAHFFADEPPHSKHESARRVAIALILGHLETLQQPSDAD